MSNLLVFHLRGLSLVLWLLLAAVSGVFGGWLAHLVLQRIRIPKKQEGTKS